MAIASKAPGAHSARPAMEEVSIAEAKAHLSSILNGVENLRRPVTISRRGIPIAQIIPIAHKSAPKLSGSMSGTGRILGDIESPLEIEWTAGDQ
ncbi:prevent-host-death family protein [Granulicella rosea]|uniref:Antitoxin n=1 Tax=Granulicella rosea TaxID=474952 RepID=A0A239IQZ9_9BACT|nr:type II toxin-antitoxin system prevent-host-death family antitoxin [Granulicella rosea]SNS95822.1 prevent-host-death family protein [Granulicella rosea]